MKFFILVFASTLLLATTSLAATVSQVKGKNVLLTLDGEDASAGDDFFVVDSNGKRIGIVKIKTVKNGKAIATLTKGRAAKGASLQARVAGGNANRPSAATDSGIVKKRTALSVGALLGFSQNSMKLTIQNPDTPTQTEDATLTGNSFSIKGFFDYDFSPSLTFRGAFGLEPFTSKGSIGEAICSDGTSTSCEATFNYMAFEGSAHYNLTTTGTRYWVGLGYSFLMEMSKSINIPNLQSEGKTNQILLFGGGADFQMGSGFVPVVLEYGMFPGSSNVVANSIYLRSGYGFFW